MDNELSVVIVNYKTPHLVIDAIQSFQGLMGRVRLFVIDNASNDNSVSEISNYLSAEGLDSQATVVGSDKNSGFSSGNNIGIKQCKSEFILLLNSDTIVRPEALEKLVKTLVDNPDKGMASPRLEWPDGSPQESCFQNHRPVNELIRSAATRQVTQLLKRYEVPQRVSDDICCPEWTSFACVLVRRKVFEDIGLLDEGFFMYFEDVDFCMRAAQKGWGIIHNPSARVVHLRGGSSPVKSQTAKKKRLPRYFYESRARYYHKHFGIFGLLRANIFWHLGWSIAMLRKVANRSYQPNICESQWRDIWCSFSNPSKPYTHPDSNR